MLLMLLKPPRIHALSVEDRGERSLGQWILRPYTICRKLGQCLKYLSGVHARLIGESCYLLYCGSLGRGSVSQPSQLMHNQYGISSVLSHPAS